jgi:sucrose-6-phosphate hydrolase SacC (GH32 family)
MLECPSSAKMGDKRVLIMSPQGLKDKDEHFWNVYSSVYMVGSLDLKKLDYSKYKEIDHGLDFYAPHIISNGNILISWMNIWERNIPLQEMGSKWINAFTLPRRVSLKNNKLIQKPFESFNNYFINEKTFEGKIKKEINIEELKGRYKHHHIEFNHGGELSVKLLKKEDKYLEIKYENNTLTFDRRNSLYSIKSYKEEKSSCNYRMIKLPKKKVMLDIYLDGSFIEVYINNGEEVMSMTCFHPLDYEDISLSSKNGKKVRIISKDFIS